MPFCAREEAMCVFLLNCFHALIFIYLCLKFYEFYVFLCVCVSGVPGGLGGSRKDLGSKIDIYRGFGDDVGSALGPNTGVIIFTSMSKNYSRGPPGGSGTFFLGRRKKRQTMLLFDFAV